MIRPDKLAGIVTAWRLSEGGSPYPVTLGRANGRYGWSLGTGRVPWSELYSTEAEALQAMRQAKEREEMEVKRAIAQIDNRLRRLTEGAKCDFG